jgi:anti-sigma factor RsiW
VTAFHPDELLPQLVAGGIAAEDRASMDEHLSRCPRCRMEHARLAEAAALLAVALEPVPSPRGARDRLLAAVRGGA